MSLFSKVRFILLGVLVYLRYFLHQVFEAKHNIELNDFSNQVWVIGIYFSLQAGPSFQS